MMRAISIEFFKFRHRHIYLMATLFLLIEVIFLFMGMSRSISMKPENANWEALIVMFASMNGLLFPILIAVSVSRICDMEHKGNTWKLLLTLSIKPGQVYAAKYIYACILILWVCIVQVLSIAAFGIVKDFEDPLPTFLLIRYFFGIVFTSLAIVALQQWVSLMKKNQVIALTLGMIGGFIGMTADLMPSGVSRIFIWSYYSGLSPVSLSYESEELDFIVRNLNALLPLMLIVIIAAISIYLAGSMHLSRKEV